MSAASHETTSPQQRGIIQDPTDVPDVEGATHSNSSSAPTAALATLARPNSKKALTAYVRILHEEMLHLHKLTAGFDFYSYHRQQTAVLPLAELLTGLNYRLEVMRGEIGNEAYYDYLRLAPVWEIRGKVRELEDQLTKMEGALAGTMSDSERRREVEGRGSESTSVKDGKGQTWGGWFLGVFGVDDRELVERPK